MYYPEIILNRGATCWRSYRARAKGFAEKGAEKLKLKSRVREVISFPAFGTISCLRKKTPLWIVAKGRTPLCEKKSGADRGLTLCDRASSIE
jgi:hypothetical protein